MNFDPNTKRFAIAGVLGAIAFMFMGYQYGTHRASERERRGQDDSRRPFSARHSEPEDPCVQYPQDPVCRKAISFPTGTCFYTGSPCDEGGGPLPVPAFCSPDEPWLSVIEDDYPLKKIEGFAPSDSPVLKNFNIRTFQSLVGLMARANGSSIMAGQLLPHELNPGERDSLAAGAQMYNQLVDETPTWLAERAKRLEQECSALRQEGHNTMPLRCVPFESCSKPIGLPDLPETENEDAGAEEGVDRMTYCFSTLKVLIINGIQPKGPIPECIHLDAGPVPTEVPPPTASSSASSPPAPFSPTRLAPNSNPKAK